MTHHFYWAAIILFLLGAYHGINPGMGWLFAVALGLQERSRRAVLRALLPIAIGHLCSVGLVVAVVVLIQAAVPYRALRVGSAAVLVAFGVYRLVRSRHPRWVGMRVGFRDLTLWSFLMASAHGAGLMLVPIILAGRTGASPPDHSMHHSTLVMSASEMGVTWLVPVGIHTLGYLLLTALVALIVYEKVGVQILSRVWLNLDFVWAIALVLTGILTLFV